MQRSRRGGELIPHILENPRTVLISRHLYSELLRQDRNNVAHFSHGECLSNTVESALGEWCKSFGILDHISLCSPPLGDELIRTFVRCFKAGK